MTISPGSRLGPYEIVAPLGAGGMGEVYRARDTKLDREVAIKLLPKALGADPERLARFEREAKLLASLNHSGIAHLYGFEAATLDDGASGHFLVMELAAGENLAERLKRGAIPIDEALAIARQIAEAFEEAHDRGIVHRDLKPANVMLAPDGKVKVLDFGLARACATETGGPGGSSELSQSPTLAQAQAGTMAGMILGTAAYMSPEQARGKPLDKRADIWAFGVVTFEMLTGTRLFSGETVSDTLASVLRQEIDFGALPTATPAAVRRLLARCLERDPRKRLRDLGEARLVIDEALAGAGAGAGAEAQPPPVVPSARPRTRWWSAAAVIGVIAALGVGFGAGWRMARPGAARSGPAARWALAIPDGLALSAAEYPQVALSEDGRTQVVVAVDQAAVPHLLVRQSDEFEPRVLSDSDNAISPFLSPDGKWVAFFRDISLYKLPLAGGPPTRLAETTGGQIRGGTWSRDGFIYFVPDTNVGLSRVSENGGEVTPATRLDEARDERTHRWPQALPDGSAVLFTCDTQASTEYYDDARIEAVRPATGERKVLLEGSSQAWYAPGGHLVFARGGSIYSVPLDIKTLEVHGSPIQVAQGVATDVGSGAVQFHVSQSGAALWRPGGGSVSYELVILDRKLAETTAPVPPAPYNEMALSPDGKRLALVGGQGGVADLWVADLARGALTRLTFGEFVSAPVWTPDGLRIAFGSRLQGRKDNVWAINWRPADGSRDAETLVEGPRIHAPSSFTPDGQSLIFDAVSGDATTRDVFVVSIAGDRRPRSLITGPFLKLQGVVSPNGRWIAYVSNEGGQNSVFVRPFPSGEGRWQISTPYGIEPRWSRDGNELFYRYNAAIYRVPVVTAGGSFSAGRPERLFDRVASGGLAYTYTPKPDGSGFVTFRSPDRGSSTHTLYLDLGFADRLRSPVASGIR